MNLLSVETYRCESKQLLGGYGSVAHPRVASLQWFGRCDGRDRMVDCIRVPGLAGCQREESGTCCFVDMPRARAKKVFGILRKFTRGSTRHAGRMMFIDFHLVVPSSMSVAVAHDVCDRL